MYLQKQQHRNQPSRLLLNILSHYSLESNGHDRVYGPPPLSPPSSPTPSASTSGQGSIHASHSFFPKKNMRLPPRRFNFPPSGVSSLSSRGHRRLLAFAPPHARSRPTEVSPPPPPVDVAPPRLVSQCTEKAEVLGCVHVMGAYLSLEVGTRTIRRCGVDTDRTCARSPSSLG